MDSDGQKVILTAHFILSAKSFMRLKTGSLNDSTTYLYRSATGWDICLYSGGKISTSKLFFLSFAATHNWNGEQFLVHTCIQLQNGIYLQWLCSKSWNSKKCLWDTIPTDSSLLKRSQVQGQGDVTWIVLPKETQTYGGYSLYSLNEIKSYNNKSFIFQRWDYMY